MMGKLIGGGEHSQYTKAKLGCNLVLLLAPYFGNAPTIRLLPYQELVERMGVCKQNVNR